MDLGSACVVLHYFYDTGKKIFEYEQTISQKINYDILNNGYQINDESKF